jgi:aryl-alcohol dehydrogenase-like predicted oxidoreductase
MKYRILGRTKLKVSELGFGGHEYKRPLPTTLGRWGDIDLEEFLRKQPERNELVKRAIESGINYFDATQPEEAKSLGMALKEIGAREDVYVALMILRPLKKLASRPQNEWRSFIKKDVEEKLELLQSDYTDVLNVHLPEEGYSRERLTETINALKEMKEENIIRWLAASSHKPRFLAELIRIYDCFDSVMVRYNYHLQEARQFLFPVCKAFEVGVVVMKPIAWPYYGIPFTFFGPAQKESRLSTPVQTSLRWILKCEEVSTVVPGMNDEKELLENLEAVEKKEEIEEKTLYKYLEVAQSPEAKIKLEKILNNPSIDIRYFANRALKEYFT